MADEPQHPPAKKHKLDLKKKLGPLPVWGWIVGGAGALGVLYYLHRSSSAASTAAATPVTSTATTDPGAGVPDDGGGGGGADTSSPVDTSGLATGTITTDQLDQDIQAGFAELASQAQNPVVDNAPTFGQEVTDVTGAVAALRKAGFVGQPAKGSSAAAKAKGVPHLTIVQQLEDLRKGTLTRGQLGPNARKALTNNNNNVGKAIAARQKPKPKKPVQRKTPPARPR